MKFFTACITLTIISCLYAMIVLAIMGSFKLFGISPPFTPTFLAFWIGLIVGNQIGKHSSKRKEEETVTICN